MGDRHGAEYIPAGFCDNCGEQIFVGMKFCGTCGKRLDANTQLIPSNLAPTQAVLPPTQYVFPPTQPVSPSMLPPTTLVSAPNLPPPSLEEQIDIARTSLSNPYANWGTLICDDSAKKMWAESYNPSYYYKCAYAGNAFCILGTSVYPINVAAWVSDCAVPLNDFTFQVHMKIQHHPDNVIRQAGLVFRSDNSGSICYSFYVHEDGSKKEAILEAKLGGMSLELVRKEITSKGPVTDEYLLAVVAQGPMIDLYVDCTHISPVRDYHISSGAVGLSVGNVKAVIFTHAKVWTKDDPKKVKIK